METVVSDSMKDANELAEEGDNIEEQAGYFLSLEHVFAHVSRELVHWANSDPAASMIRSGDSMTFDKKHLLMPCAPKISSVNASDGAYNW